MTGDLLCKNNDANRELMTIGKDKNLYHCKLFAFILVAIIFLDVYKMPILSFLSVGEFLLILFSPIFIVNAKKLFYVDKSNLFIFIFCFYGVCASFCVAVINNAIYDVAVRVIREGFYFFYIFILGKRYFNYKIFKSYFSKLILVLAAFVLLQVLVYYSTGYLIPGFILDAKLNDGNFTGLEMYNSILRYGSNNGYIKPSGFLCEPAHCAHFFFLYLLMNLFDDKRIRVKYFKCVFVSFAMVATMSTSAFLELVISWLFWLLYQKKISVFIKSAIILLCVCVSLVLLNSTNNSFMAVIERFTNIFLGGDSVTESASLRVLKGFDVFNSMPFYYKIFGVGFGGYNSAVNNGIIFVSGYDLSNEYLNTISYLLVSSGILGTSLFVVGVLKSFFKKHIMQKILTISMIVLFFGTSIYCTVIFICFMLIIMKKGILDD